MNTNRRVLLRRRPQGEPVAADFDLATEAMPVPREGEILIRNIFCSIDPAMRGWMDDVPSYMPPIALGAPIRATTYGQVVASHAAGFAEGDYVIGLNAVEEFSIASTSGFTTRVDHPLPQRFRRGRPHRLFRPARNRPTQSRRNRASLRRGRRRRLARRPARPPARLPHNRHRRRPGKMPPPHRGIRF
jgi:hypothetical protein